MLGICRRLFQPFNQTPNKHNLNKPIMASGDNFPGWLAYSFLCLLADALDTVLCAVEPRSNRRAALPASG